jgi:hypothetical protein
MNAPITMEAKAFVLLFMILNECKKVHNDKTLEKNIDDLRGKISEETFKTAGFLKPLKLKAKEQFEFCYAKLNTEIQANSFKTIQFKGNNLLKIEKLFSDILGSKYPNEELIKAGLSGFAEYLESLFTNETAKLVKPDLVNERTVSEVQSKFSKTKWFFYHHDYESDTPLTEITRLLLVFDDLTKPGNNTILYGRRSTEDFEGIAELIPEVNHTNFIINLKRTKATPKNLQIRFVVTDGIEEDSIYLGQYIDFEKGETIITGTFILENVLGHFHRRDQTVEQSNKQPLDRQIMPDGLLVVKRELAYYSGWEHYFPNEIAAYLENKWMNFTKVKTNIGSLNELVFFRKKQEKKLFLNTKFNTFIRYDIFIITPVNSLSKTESNHLIREIGNVFFEYPEICGESQEELNKQCFEAKRSLTEELGVKKLFYSPRQYKIENPRIHEEEDANEILKNDLYAMRSSRFVILVMPKRICTSALIKVGWAIQMEKPIFVFQTRKGSLPDMLCNDYKKIIKVVSKPKSIRQIPDYLKVNCKEFFTAR